MFLRRKYEFSLSTAAVVFSIWRCVLFSHSLVKVCSDMSEKCTGSVFRVTEPNSDGCRSNWEEWICRLDRKGEGNFAKSKVWKCKNFVLSQREFRVPKRGQSVYEEWLHEEKDNAIFKNDETLSSNTTSPPSRPQSSATLLSELKSHICRTNKELQGVLNYLL